MTNGLGRLSPLLLGLTLAACPTTPAPTSPVARHSSSIAISPDGKRVFAANPDSDSISIINAKSRQLEKELLLADAAPTVDANGRFTPAVMPRTVALAPRANVLYVSGERSGVVYAVDLATNAITRRTTVCSEPVGLLVAPDESAVFVTCSNDEQVMRVDAKSGQTTSVATSAKPWALAWSADAKQLIVTHLLSPAVSVIDPAKMKVTATWTLPDIAPKSDARYPNGTGRSLYDVTPRPGAKELWVAHNVLSTTTAQPTLNFETTVFPAIAVFQENGTLGSRFSTDVQDIPGPDGVFADIVSGPHALEFTSDGRFALMLDSGSEDILVVDAVKGTNPAILRPLPGDLPDGLVLSPDGTQAWVNERNSGDVAVISIKRTDTSLKLSVDGDVISKYTVDPMPAQMRLGQHLFFSANSDELPITRNHWVSCSSCHPEGRSDAVTWRFLPGPRDTPSNVGGTKDTGFLLHTADRVSVQDYWRTIEVEQGGVFKPTTELLRSELDALARFVNDGIPVPIPPKTDPARVAQGKAIFERADVGCATCHYGPALTDSGAGNPTLDLTGTLNLHDVGTCDRTSAFPDVDHTDDDGHPRGPCQFDTPALRGLVDSAPYFHDGRAATLRDALEQTRGTMGNINVLSADEETALIEYLRSL